MHNYLQQIKVKEKNHMTKKKVKLSVTSLLISALLIFSCVGAYAAQNSNQ